MSAPEGEKPPAEGGEGEGGEAPASSEPPPPNPQHQAASRRLQQTQAQVNEVVDIMRTNVEKVLERDQKLSELDERAALGYMPLERAQHLLQEGEIKLALQQGASQFEQQAGKLKSKFWWKNAKMIIIMVVMGVFIFGIIGAWAYSKYST